MLTIEKDYHKSTLYGRLLIGPNGQERKFPLHKLNSAASAAKKLREGTDEVKNEAGQVVGLNFKTSPVEMDMDETKILKELVDEITEAPIREIEIIGELKEILK